MGNWKIEIDGFGIHHNSREDDADALAKDFVRGLIAKGHKVTSARLVLANYDGSPAAGNEPTDLTT